MRGWPARILQHEVDHLDGTLYIDRMQTQSFATAAHATKFYAAKSVAEVCRLLGIPEYGPDNPQTPAYITH